MIDEWRGSKGAREGNFHGDILRSALTSTQYIHKPSYNAALAIDTLNTLLIGIIYNTDYTILQHVFNNI